MYDFTKFNLIEGIFWIFLSSVSVVLSIKLDRRYRAISITFAVALFLFGISDFVESRLGSFLEPHLWWLYVWKIILAVMFLIIIVWYFKLRLSKNLT